MGYEPTPADKEIIDNFIYAYNTDQLFVLFGENKTTGEVHPFIAYIEQNEDGNFFVPLGRLYRDNQEILDNYNFEHEDLEFEEEDGEDESTEFTIEIDEPKKKNLLSRLLGR